MRCDYFDAGVCRSCSLLETAYGQQLRAKATQAQTALAGVAPEVLWLDPAPSPPEGFRNKAKLVVGGSPDSPTLGILGPDQRGVDLRHCGLHEPAIRAVLPELADVVAATGLVPYDVPGRRGELKYLLLTASPTGALMLRVVLRSTDQLPRLRGALPRLLARVPALAVVSANIHPEHKAVLEGDLEIVLTDAQTLPMPLDEVTLQLRPRSFFQTNTTIARGLYRQARTWITAADPASVLDLYCGVGGFALYAAAPGRAVTGVEVSPEAIDSARLSAADLLARHPGLGPLAFAAGDATAYALRSAGADLVVVNPPRRGLDPQLTAWLDRTDTVRHVVYSSCHLDTLVRDLHRMPRLRARQARMFDMFPHTTHVEVMVLLERAP